MHMISKHILCQRTRKGEQAERNWHTFEVRDGNLIVEAGPRSLFYLVVKHDGSLVLRTVVILYKSDYPYDAVEEDHGQGESPRVCY